MLDEKRLSEIVKLYHGGKANTRKTYTTSLLKIVNSYNTKYDTKVGNLSFLKKYDRIIEILPSKVTTKRNYITAILVVLRRKKRYEEVYNKYKILIHQVNKDYDEWLKKHQKTEEQRLNWVSWEKLNSVRLELKQLVKDRHILKKKELTNREFGILQDLVIASLYLLSTPRRCEYADTKIVKAVIFNKMEEEKRQENNWLVVQSRNRKFFYFTKNNYKTGRTYGNRKVLISKKLNTILNLWLKYNDEETKPNRWLLYGSNGGKMTCNNIGKHISRIFTITGRRISVNLLRHIYATEVTMKDINLEQIENVIEKAKDMGHCALMHIEYCKT
tara:strand:+ start:612 stop:1601 length:990 start_codon:yes stop_codon:yes gene_type:complete